MKMLLACIAVFASSLVLLSTSAKDKATAQTIQGADSGALTAKGKVVGPSSEPQPGVPVQIVGPNGRTVATTDKNGMWSLYNAPPGDYKAKLFGNSPSDSEFVTFSVEKRSLWDQFLNSKSNPVSAPEIEIK